MKPLETHIKTLVCFALTIVLFHSCARMGQPDGGWFDETPPRVIGSTPVERGTNVNQKRVRIFFNEYIKLENASEKLTYCPPQMEMPEVKAGGKSIIIDFQDSLKANTTYTIDFSDAIVDNNEGNPMGNYTFVFSTGEHIDTMEVSGYVLNASDLEPIKGILVGLYDNHADSAFTTQSMLRIARTNGSGQFLIRGVAPGNYRIAALEDSDGDYKLSQRGERLAFSHDIIVPSQKDDIRLDTIWQDQLHIKEIQRTPYIHYLPDDIVLQAFNQELTGRYLVKTDRTKEDHFTIFFSYGSTELPRIKGLNFNSDNAFLTEHSEKLDTVTYWLRDTALVNQDTLRMEVRYLMTDSLDNIVYQTDTLEVLAKTPLAKRQKQMADKVKDWEKKVEKLKKKATDSDKEPELPRNPMNIPLEPKYELGNSMSANSVITVEIPTPVAHLDTAAIHLYSKIDTLWYRSRIAITDKDMPPRRYKMYATWRPGTEYSLEIDSAAFTDIYGHASDPYKTGFKIKTEDEFSSLFVNVNIADSLKQDSLIIVQMLNQGDNVVREEPVIDGTAEFYYVNAGTYYIRCFVDSNRNGIWDTGDYAEDRQAEQVYYYNNKVECQVKRDETITIDTSIPLQRQKPSEITKQKPDKTKTIKMQNLTRAAQMGIMPPNTTPINQR